MTHILKFVGFDFLMRDFLIIFYFFSCLCFNFGSLFNGIVWVFAHLLGAFTRERLWNDNKVICKFDKIVKGTLSLANACGGM
jgi:hypothetical protein